MLLRVHVMYAAVVTLFARLLCDCAVFANDVCAIVVRFVRWLSSDCVSLSLYDARAIVVCLFVW